jgi:chemotaxis protein MotB
MTNGKRNKRPEEEENLERWMVSYADFVTLMFAFFVSMYAISQVDIKKLGMYTKSLQQAFNHIAITNSPRAIMTASSSDPIMIPKIDLIKPIVSKTEMDRMENLKVLFKKIAQETKGLDNDFHITMDQRGLILHLGNKILFPSGEAAIRAEAFPLLDKLAQTLLLIPNLIRVEGHTDNIAINTPEFPSNWELSTARAARIIRYFIDQCNFSPSRLSAAGYAEYHPIASNDTSEGRRYNRRVNIVIVYSNEEDQKAEKPSS